MTISREIAGSLSQRQKRQQCTQASSRLRFSILTEPSASGVSSNDIDQRMMPAAEVRKCHRTSAGRRRLTGCTVLR